MSTNDGREAPPPYQAHAHGHYPPPPPPGQVIYQQPPPPPTVYITHAQPIPGACPVCQNTQWVTTFPCMAWVVAFVFFPLGILCCLLMSQKVCSKCGLQVSN